MASVSAMFLPVEYLADLADETDRKRLAGISEFRVAPECTTLAEALESWLDLLYVLERSAVWLDSKTFLAPRALEFSWDGILAENFTCHFSVDVSPNDPQAICARNIGIFSTELEHSKSAMRMIHPMLTSLEDKVSELTLVGSRVHSRLPQMNLSFPGLSRLVLRDLVLSSYHCQTLFTLNNIEVRFDHSVQEDDGSALIEALSRTSTKSPQRLSFWNSLGVSRGASIKLFHAIEKSVQLEKLDLFCLQLDDTQFHTMTKAVSRNTSLRSLRLFGRSWKPGHFEAFCQILRHQKSLLKLSLRCSFPFPMTTDREQRSRLLFKFLLQNHTIQSLNLSTNEHDPAIEKAIQSLIHVNRYRPVIQRLHQCSTRNAQRLISGLLPQIGVQEQYILIRGSSDLIATFL